MGDKKLPRGLRNNNPGNIRISRTVWAGQVFPGTDRSFCQFETMAHGYRAMLMTLRNYRRKHGCRTIADFVRRWAPPMENDTAAYIRRVCRDLQVPDSYEPDIDDRCTMCAMAAAMSKVENGCEAVMDDVYKGWELL
ncbi:MAG: structural protein P5 [Bacteroides sp.]